MKYGTLLLVSYEDTRNFRKFLIIPISSGEEWPPKDLCTAPEPGGRVSGLVSSSLFWAFLSQ